MNTILIVDNKPENVERIFDGDDWDDGGAAPFQTAAHPAGVRRYRDHLLGEGEEKIMAEKGVTGSGALPEAAHSKMNCSSRCSWASGSLKPE